MRPRPARLPSLAKWDGDPEHDSRTCEATDTSHFAAQPNLHVTEIDLGRRQSFRCSYVEALIEALIRGVIHLRADNDLLAGRLAFGIGMTTGRFM